MEENRKKNAEFLFEKKKRAKQLTFDIEQKRALKGVFVLKKKRVVK